jgi:hypothetical protein
LEKKKGGRKVNNYGFQFLKLSFAEMFLDPVITHILPLLLQSSWTIILSIVDKW